MSRSPSLNTSTGSTTDDYGEIGHVPPAEFVTKHWARQAVEHYSDILDLIKAGSK